MPRSRRTIGPTLYAGCGHRPKGPGARRIMAHVIVRMQLQPVAPSPFPHVTTLLICRNTVLHTGLRHVLSDTQFALADNVFEPTSDISALAESEPVLVLLCEK